MKGRHWKQSVKTLPQHLGVHRKWHLLLWHWFSGRFSSYIIKIPFKKPPKQSKIIVCTVKTMVLYVHHCNAKVLFVQYNKNSVLVTLAVLQFLFPSKNKLVMGRHSINISLRSLYQSSSCFSCHKKYKHMFSTGLLVITEQYKTDVSIRMSPETNAVSSPH